MDYFWGTGFVMSLVRPVLGRVYDDVRGQRFGSVNPNPLTGGLWRGAEHTCPSGWCEGDLRRGGTRDSDGQPLQYSTLLASIYPT